MLMEPSAVCAPSSSGETPPTSARMRIPQTPIDLSQLTAPSPWLLAMEFRAPWEFGALFPAWPLLQRSPRGDGHTVLVFPGLSASDASTLPLRKFIETRGYATDGWNQGFNFGPRAGVLDAIKAQVRNAVQTTGRPVSLVGWSLGGIYAREIAKELPDHVRGVITLGTPFAGPPQSTNAWRIYELVSSRSIEREREAFDLPVAPSVPTTSIFSRTDGIVAWQGSIQTPSAHNPNTENIEVVASHIGMGMNPSAWWAVADRLAQPQGSWAPFVAPSLLGMQNLVYPNPER